MLNGNNFTSDSQSSEKSGISGVFSSQNRFDPLADNDQSDNDLLCTQWTEVVNRKRARVNTGGESYENAGQNSTLQNTTLQEFENLDFGNKLSVLFTRSSSIESKVDACLSLFSRVDTIENTICDYDLRMKLLEYKSIDIEARSRRNNLIFGGIPEQRDENCVSRIADFLRQHLQIDPCPSIPRAHRLGRFKRDHTRAIVVYFLDYRDTEKVLANASKLKGSDYNINRDYPKEIVSGRKLLWPEYKRLRQNFPDSKVSIVYPAKLVKDGRVLADAFPYWNQILQRDRVYVTRPQFTPVAAPQVQPDQSVPYSAALLNDTRPQPHSVQVSTEPQRMFKDNQFKETASVSQSRDSCPSSSSTVRMSDTVADTRKGSGDTPTVPAAPQHKSRRAQSSSPYPLRACRPHAPVSTRVPYVTQNSPPRTFQRPWVNQSTPENAPSRTVSSQQTTPRDNSLPSNRANVTH